MEMFSSIIDKIISEAQQSSTNSIVNQARDLKEPATIEAFKSTILDDYLKLLANCVSCKNSKLRQLGINGYETIIRDNSLWRPDVCENHFFNQIISSIGSKIINCNEIIQIELVKCLLEVTCSRISHLRFTDLEKVSDICCSTIISCSPLTISSSKESPSSSSTTTTSSSSPSSYSSTSNSLAASLSSLASSSSVDPLIGSSTVSPKITASTATAIQSYRYFIGYLITESSIELRDAINHQIIPLLDSLTGKIIILRKRCYLHGKGDKSSRSQIILISFQISFNLKCINAILTSLEIDKSIEKDLTDFVWQKLGPMLIKLLNFNMNRVIKSPRVDKSSIKKNRKNSKDEIYGRGSECLSFNDKNIIQLKEVYGVARELVRLFGPIKYMRPVLESIFHRMLLYPLIHFRFEALQSIKELFKDNQCLIKLCTTVDSPTQLSCTDKDLNLIRIIIDSLVECSSTNDQEIIFQSVYCIISLINSLDSIVSGKNLTNQGYNCVVESEDNCGNDGDGERRKVNFGKGDSIDTEEGEDEDLSQSSNDVFTQPNLVLQSDNEMEITSYKSKLKEIIDNPDGDDQSDDNQCSLDDDYEADEDDSASDELFVTDEGESLKQSVSSFGSQCTLDEKTNQDDDVTISSIIESNVTKSNVSHDKVSLNGENNEEMREDNQRNNYRSRIISEVRQENERQQIILDNHDSLINQERENARDMIKDLIKILGDLLTMKNSVQIDNELQKFASNFCKTIWEKRKSTIITSSDPLIINGDGVYLAVYSTLSLNLKLMKDNYYNLATQSKPPITEQQFIDDIYNSGVLVYLSSTWLAELYQQVLVNNLLGDVGYTYSLSNNIALINMIRDIDGGDQEVAGSYELSGYRKLTQTNLQLTTTVKDGQNIGQVIARRLVDTFWESIIKIMESIFTNDANSSSNLSPFLLLLNHDNEKSSIERRTIMINCLLALQTASKLCITLGLQSRCKGIFHLLTRAIIVSPHCVSIPLSTSNSEMSTNDSKENKGSVVRLLSKQNPISLHVSQILSLRSILTTGLQIATHCEPCWDYIFQSCAFISELENDYFSSRTKKPFKNRLTSLLRPRKQSADPTPELNFSQHEMSSSLLGMESESDVNKCLDQCIETVMNEKNGRKGEGIIVDSLLERSLECLSHLSDRLFTEATSRLNLRSLLTFLEALIANSSNQINKISKKSNIKSTSILLFSRFCDVLLRIGKSGRPLVHFMRCWGLSVPHLIEASNCSKFDLIICKSAVSAVNDIISTILAIHTELDHFHFNEALFIPYEKILRLELCDSDIQEMIVSSICGFVEGSREDIKSGWRSLFAALRGVVLPESRSNLPISKNNSNQNKITEPTERSIERVRQLRVILDIFEAFLNTQKLDIFANSALDCIICLLDLMRDPLEDESNQQPINDDYDLPSTPNETHFEIDCKSLNGNDDVDLCLLSLKYLHQFESMLRSMYKLPDSPFFISSRRITLSEEPKTIEIPEYWSTELSSLNFDVPIKLSSFDKPSRILNVWFTLIDGIFNCINRCPKIRQAKTIETCMAILGTLRSNPGNQFAIYCINHSALPFLQKWTHEINSQLSSLSSNSPSSQLTNFKHFFGLITHLIVQHVKLWAEDDQSLIGVDLMITQTVIILIEATQSSYKESISNLASSCFSHVIMETYQYFDEEKWSIISIAFRLMHSTCLTSMVKLINAFPNRSLDFYKDLERIRVVARRVQTVPKADLITKGLAQQVFLLNFQKPRENDQHLSENFSETEKYFIFEIITDENNEFEIPFRDLIREINKHSTLVRLIGSIVLSGKRFTVSPVSYFIEINENNNQPDDRPIAISSSFVSQSLDMLMDSYRDFHEFDTRLGLKLVIQKMARLHVPANLYKQSASCFATCFLICFNQVYQMLIDQENTNQLEDIDSFGNNLRKTFDRLCGHYTDFIVQGQQEKGKVDQLMGNPVFLFPESLSNSCESTCDQDDKDNIRNEFIIDDIGRESDLESCKEIKSDIETQNETKNYIVMSKNRIDSVMRNYRKWKSQHSPLPPSFNDSWNQKNQLPKRYRGKLSEVTTINNGLNQQDGNCDELDKEGDYLIKDSEAYETLYSQILISIFQCLLTLTDYQFNHLMPYLNQGIESLIIYSQSKELRSLIALIYRRYSQRN